MTDAFRDRQEAGERLAAKLVALKLADPVILALPRGGVPVARPVAQALAAPLDLLMVRKIGVPQQPELAAGAVVDGAAHELVFNDEIMAHLRLSRDDLQPVIDRELARIEDRRGRYLGGRAPLDVTGRDAVVVDDGIATGATVQAALRGLSRRAPASVTLAVPVAPPDTLEVLRPLVDHLVCLSAPRRFMAVGGHYIDFSEVSDADVVEMMAEARQASGERGSEA